MMASCERLLAAAGSRPRIGKSTTDRPYFMNFTASMLPLTMLAVLAIVITSYFGAGAAGQESRSTQFQPSSIQFQLSGEAAPSSAPDSFPPAAQSPAAQPPTTQPPRPAEAPAAPTKQPEKPANADKPPSDSKAPPTGEKTPPAEAPPAPASAAEQVTRLQQAVQDDISQIAALRAELSNPESEYAQAEAAFLEVNKQVETLSAELNDPTTLNTNRVLELQEKLEEIKERHLLSRQRFDLAIETRRTIHDQIAALEDKLRQDQAALAKFNGTSQNGSSNGNAAGTSDAPMQSPNDAPPNGTSAPPTNTDGASGSGTTNSSNSSTNGSGAAPASPTDLTTPPASDPSLVPILRPSTKAPSKEVIEAEDEAKQLKRLADDAELEVKTIADRIAAIDRSIELENRQLVASRKRSDLAYQAAQAIEREKEKMRMAGATETELMEIRSQREKAEDHFQAARLEAASRIDRLNELQEQRAQLQKEEIAAIQAARLKQEEAAVAEYNVSSLKNPFSPQNLLQWLLDHGPKIGIILVSMLGLRWLLTLTKQRIVQLIAHRGARGTQHEREDRARTLVGVFHNAASGAIVLVGTLMIFEEVGVAVAPLMGGAAVVGLAVAFGAQNLIRDYFYGFVILLENQYKINDVLKIGEIAGQVEQITLRMTVLRDLEGNVHFIPNGKIDSVTNMTHGWARAVLDIPISYEENTDRIMDLVMEIAGDLRKDPEYAWQILDNPEMLGVEAFGDSSVTIKFFIKTRPLSKHPVRRELLRRIKRKFDELGVEIPFQQQVVHYRQEKTASAGDEDSPASPNWPHKKMA